MKDQNETIIRPYIVINTFLKPSNPNIFLSITNKGKTAADKLRLTIDNDKHVYSFGEKKEDHNLGNLHVFKEEIVCFPPDASLTFYLDLASVILEKNADQNITPKMFKITAKYFCFGKEVKETTTIDLNQYFGTAYEQDPLIEKLEKIKKNLKDTNTILSKLSNK